MPLELVGSCKTVGQTALKFLEVLKQQKVGSGDIASQANDVQKSIRALQRLTGVGEERVFTCPSACMCVRVYRIY